MFGGGMRQAGIIAAAALYALEHHIERLAEDHARARRLAAGLAGVPGLGVENDPPDTNMVYVQVGGATVGSTQTAPAVCAALKDLGVLCMAVSPSRIRLVVHLDVDDEDIERAIAGFRRVAAGGGRRESLTSPGFR